MSMKYLIAIKAVDENLVFEFPTSQDRTEFIENLKARARRKGWPEVEYAVSEEEKEEIEKNV